jgi:hypothetical protein
LAAAEDLERRSQSAFTSRSQSAFTVDAGVFCFEKGAGEIDSRSAIIHANNVASCHAASVAQLGRGAGKERQSGTH